MALETQYRENITSSLTLDSSIPITSSNLSVSLEAILKAYLGPTSKFRDNYQREAIRSILNRYSFTTYINKIGLGKSLIFLLPSFYYKDRYNIVLTPRIALKNNLYKRAIESGIDTTIIEDINLESNS